MKKSPKISSLIDKEVLSCGKAFFYVVNRFKKSVLIDTKFVILVY